MIGHGSIPAGCVRCEHRVGPVSGQVRRLALGRINSYDIRLMRSLMETQDPAQLSWVVALLTAEDIDFQVFDSHVSSLFGSSVD